MVHSSVWSAALRVYHMNLYFVRHGESLRGAQQYLSRLLCDKIGKRSVAVIYRVPEKWEEMIGIIGEKWAEVEGIRYA